MLLALDFFHKKKIIQRDTKLDNILITQIEDQTSYEIRIADFGLATFTPNDELIAHRCGSQATSPPRSSKGSPTITRRTFRGWLSIFQPALA
jgi:serine/threonine protein kinase